MLGDRLDLGGTVADGGVAGVEHGEQLVDERRGGALAHLGVFACSVACGSSRTRP